MRTPKTLLVLTSVSLLVSSTARADSPYGLERSEEYVWVGTAAAMWAAASIMITQIDPISPAEVAALDPANINKFDRDWMEPYREDHVGDVMVMTSFMLPLTFLTRSDMRDDAGTLGAMWLEATALSQGLVFMTKSIVPRPRPYVYDPETPAVLKTRKNARFSFFSGHTTAAATNTFFMATVFSDYSEDRTAEIAVWSGAVVYSALTGLFRIHSGHHFATDAITGFVIGATVGYLVPAMHREDKDGSNTPPSANSTFGISATFAF